MLNKNKNHQIHNQTTCHLVGKHHSNMFHYDFSQISPNSKALFENQKVLEKKKNQGK